MDGLLYWHIDNLGLGWGGGQAGGNGQSYLSHDLQLYSAINTPIISPKWPTITSMGPLG